jgi:hypothetical protein
LSPLCGKKADDSVIREAGAVRFAGDVAGREKNFFLFKEKNFYFHSFKGVHIHPLRHSRVQTSNVQAKRRSEQKKKQQ